MHCTHIGTGPRLFTASFFSRWRSRMLETASAKSGDGGEGRKEKRGCPHLGQSVHFSHSLHPLLLGLASLCSCPDLLRSSGCRQLQWKNRGLLTGYTEPDCFLDKETSAFRGNPFDVFRFSEDDNASNSSESSPESIFSEQEQLESDAQHTKNKAVNTEPHFLSISRWQPAEWKTDRKNTKEARVTSAPIRIKPIKAYYYDYDNTKRKRPSTSVRKGNSRL